MPLRTHSTAPVTVGDPLDLLAQERLWACPAPGGALHVHALGYWDE